MASGTSVVGIQQLNGNIDPGNRQLLLLISGSVPNPPRRVGFYYVEVHFVPSPGVGYLVAQGVLYSSGFRMVVPYFALSPDDKMVWWADWNEAGLSWSTRESAPPV